MTDIALIAYAAPAAAAALGWVAVWLHRRSLRHARGPETTALPRLGEPLDGPARSGGGAGSHCYR